MCDNYDAIFAEFWQWRLEESPYYAVLCGDHSQKGRLNSWSLETVESRLDTGRVLIKRLRRLKGSTSNEGVDENLEVTNNALDELDGKTSLDVVLLLHELNTYVQGLEANAFCFPMGIFDHPITAVNRMLLSVKLDDDFDLEAAFATMRAVPRAMEEVTTVFRRGIELAMTFHAVTFYGMVANLEKTNGTPADEFGWVTTLSKRLEKGDSNNNKDGDRSEKADKFLNRVKDLIETEIRPAITRFIEFLKREYVAHLRPDIAISSLPVPEGQLDLYSHCLRFHIDLPMTPKEVHDLGWKEIERIETEMHATLSEIGFDGDFSQFADHIKSQPTGFFSSPEELMSFAQSTINDWVIPSLAQCFVDVPQFPFEIRPITGRVAAGMGYYTNGTVDKSSPGIFFINLDMFSTAAKCLWLSLILHEAIPGHHLQDIYSLGAEGVPTYRRVMDGGHYIEVPARFPTHCAFGEGWALYAESLGKELGLYTDPKDYYGKLQYELLRAVRLVVDTGLHAFGWSRERAEQLFRDKLKMMSPQSAMNEVARYISYPGQCCSYKIGEITIWKARRRAEDTLGAKFDLRAFHKAILTRGFVPLTALDTIVDEFIAASI